MAMGSEYNNYGDADGGGGGGGAGANGGGGGGSHPPPPLPTASADTMTTREQLLQAEEYLSTLRSDRGQSCMELDEEGKIFLESNPTPEQERRFRLVYQLVRYQVG